MLMSRFQRRGEQQVDTDERLIRSLQYCQGDMSCRSSFLAADKGYGRERLLRVIQEKGLSFLFVMADCVLSVHPFNALSQLDCTREDLIHHREEESETIPADDTAGIIDEDAKRVQNSTECYKFQRLSVEDIWGVTNMVTSYLTMIHFTVWHASLRNGKVLRGMKVSVPLQFESPPSARGKYHTFSLRPTCSFFYSGQCWMASTMPIGA